MNDIPGMRFLKVVYLHPKRLTEKLIDTIPSHGIFEWLSGGPDNKGYPSREVWAPEPNVVASKTKLSYLDYSRGIYVKFNVVDFGDDFDALKEKRIRKHPDKMIQSPDAMDVRAATAVQQQVALKRQKQEGKGTQGPYLGSRLAMRDIANHIRVSNAKSKRVTSPVQTLPTISTSALLNLGSNFECSKNVDKEALLPSIVTTEPRGTADTTPKSSRTLILNYSSASAYLSSKQRRSLHDHSLQSIGLSYEEENAETRLRDYQQKEAERLNNEKEMERKRSNEDIAQTYRDEQEEKKRRRLQEAMSLKRREEEEMERKRREEATTLRHREQADMESARKRREEEEMERERREQAYMELARKRHEEEEMERERLEEATAQRQREQEDIERRRRDGEEVERRRRDEGRQGMADGLHQEGAEVAQRNRQAYEVGGRDPMLGHEQANWLAEINRNVREVIRGELLAAGKKDIS